MEMNMREYSSFTIGHKIKVKEQRFMGRKLKLIVYLGTYKVRNEIETKRNQRKRNEMKRNQRKQNEIDWYEENGKKKKKRQNEIKK